MLNVYRESILDHVYCTEPESLNNIYERTPIFGDHRLIVISMNCELPKITKIIKRDWRGYTVEKLVSRLSTVKWENDIDQVQHYWNHIERVLVEIVDELAPLVPFVNNSAYCSFTPGVIKNKLNIRKRLLRAVKINPNDATKLRIKHLNAEIRNYFHGKIRTKVRRGILPGNTKSLWDAVKIAKNMGVNAIPHVLYKNQQEIIHANAPEEFARFFKNKVKTITDSSVINEEVYNGKRKVLAANKMFMDQASIRTVMESIKIKNSEGYDRIPQRIIREGLELLLEPFTELFKKIYSQRTLPEQWLTAKTIPLHKKGQKKDIENYRPIANLCSISKIFEKLILKRIMEVQDLNNVDITGKQQHGFKKGKSTLSLGLKIQSLLARALDDDNYALMASLDLSAAFDVVNIRLLVKRLKIVGLPEDVINLIEIWLQDRSFYVSVNNKTSLLYELTSGTVQGSILGPILYALYVSPVFDLVCMSSFADDNFTIKWNINKNELIKDMENELEVLTKWLKDSGLKVNEDKTEIVLFYRKDSRPITLKLNGTQLVSKNSMNVLGVIFDSKLQWAQQVANSVQRARKALSAIGIIRRYFTTNELLGLMTSNYYSILYYNSEIWHVPSLKTQIKQLILSASAKALKVCMFKPETYRLSVCMRSTTGPLPTD